MQVSLPHRFEEELVIISIILEDYSMLQQAFRVDPQHFPLFSPEETSENYYLLHRRNFNLIQHHQLIFLGRLFQN